MGILIKLLILYGKLAVTAKRECWVSRGGKGDEQGRRSYSWRRARKIVHIRAPVDWTEGKEESVCQGRSAGIGQFQESVALMWKTHLQAQAPLSGPNLPTADFGPKSS